MWIRGLFSSFVTIGELQKVVNGHKSAAASSHLLWPPYGIGQAIIFSSCGFFYLSSSFFPRLINLSGLRLDRVYHTSTHGVALV